MSEAEKIVFAIIALIILVVPLKGRTEEEMKPYAHALEGTKLLGQTQCMVQKKPPYVVPCLEYEDADYNYYSLARESGEVIVINRVSKTNPADVTVHWVADSLKDALKYYERTHSF